MSEYYKLQSSKEWCFTEEIPKAYPLVGLLTVMSVKMICTKATYTSLTVRQESLSLSD